MNKKKGAGQEDGLGEKALAVKADDLSLIPRSLHDGKERLL